MAIQEATLPLKGRLFYVIQFHDVDLAEDFYRRCPDVSSVYELNNFFHSLLSQYAHDTSRLRAQLQVNENFDYWQCRFVEHVLPSLCNWRFPPFTHLQARPIYEAVPGMQPALI